MLKNLFFISEEKPENPSKAVTEGPARIQFSSPHTQEVTPPVTSTITMTPPVTATPETCKPYMDEVLQVYENGFRSLNLPGYDFFEFFQGVQSMMDNPQAYTMAFSMASSMDSSVNKDSLLKQGNYYLEEISKQHRNFSQAADNKKATLNENLRNQKEKFNSEITLLEQQINELTIKRNQAVNSLNNLDSTHMAEMNELECKSMANDHAAETLKSKINHVITGINNNI